MKTQISITNDSSFNIVLLTTAGNSLTYDKIINIGDTITLNVEPSIYSIDIAATDVRPDINLLRFDWLKYRDFINTEDKKKIIIINNLSGKESFLKNKDFS
ncbi:MAG: hypothetical protein PHF86_02125 [Candidatus Nanoarchaeia archaeon]|nr:hypothetical protein [Candidatus Nanoarchaeia archaeon]